MSDDKAFWSNPTVSGLTVGLGVPALLAMPTMQA